MEIFEEFTISVLVMFFATVLCLLLYKAKNYFTQRLMGSKETLLNPQLTTMISNNK